jgi:molybdopterin molybdotransferase
MSAETVVTPARRLGTKTGSSLDVVKALIAEHLAAPREELVALDDAAWRILAADVTATRDHWPFGRAAMDGIAVLSADVAQATSEAPVKLELRGASYCGDAPLATEMRGCAVRIATGAPLPDACDAVIEQERVRWQDGAAVVAHAVPAGNNVYPPGEDVHAGELLMRAGTRLSGARIGLLAALGYAEVPVYRRPRVALLACGDELVEPGTAPAPGRVPDSNTHALAAELRALGAEAVRLGIVSDDPALLRERLCQALEADAVVTCGGLSVGERDFVRPVLRELGAEFIVEGVPLKPGSPFSFAVAEGRPVFALPGTPGACRVTFEIFVRPAILALSGAARCNARRTFVRLESDVATRAGRTRFLWARIERDARGLIAKPLEGQGSATLRSASDAQALIALSPAQAFVAAGTDVDAWLLDEEFDPGRQRGVRAALAIVGARNAGKTTLLERLIPLLAERGLRVGVIKHHGHFERLDDDGKDTARASAAGAAMTILAGRSGFVARTPFEREPPLAELFAAMTGVDLVLVEGYASSPLPKILVHRNGVANDRDVADPPLFALVGDGDGCPGGVPRFDWDNLSALRDHLLTSFALARAPLREGYGP